MSNKKDLLSSSVKLIEKIKVYTEAGIIENHIYLIDKLKRMLEDEKKERVLHKNT